MVRSIRPGILPSRTLKRSTGVAAEILDGCEALGAGSLLLAHQLALRSLTFLPPGADTELLAAEMWIASVEFTNDDAAVSARLGSAN